MKNEVLDEYLREKQAILDGLNEEAHGKASYVPLAKNPQHLAWELYCAETAGDMHVVDFFEELSSREQEHYLQACEKLTKREINLVLNNGYIICGRCFGVFQRNHSIHTCRGEAKRST